MVGLRAKISSYFKENIDEDRKAKCTKKCVMKAKVKFQDYKNCLKAIQIDEKIKNLEKK